MNEDQEQTFKIHNSQSFPIITRSKANQSERRLSGQKQNHTSVGLNRPDKRNAKKIFKILFIVFAFVLIIIFCAIFQRNFGKKITASAHETVEGKTKLYKQNNQEKSVDFGFVKQQSYDSSKGVQDVKGNSGVLPELVSIPLSDQKEKLKVRYIEDLNNERNRQIKQKENNQIVLVDQSKLKYIPNAYSQSNQHTQNSNVPISSQKMQQYNRIPTANRFSKGNLFSQKINRVINKDQTQLRQQYDQTKSRAQMQRMERERRQKAQLRQQGQAKQFAQKRRIERERRQAAKKKAQAQNILNSVSKNPYLDEQYANISKADILRAKKWRFILTMKPQQTNLISEEEYAYYQNKYSIDKYQELPFCLVIPTFNNNANKRFLKNIVSVVSQNYTNYHFVVIDDGSSDGTGQKIKQYLLKQQKKIPPERYLVVIKQERYFAMPNLRWAAENFCSAQDIFMIVDGDDQLLGRQVLKLYNAVFQERKVWFMYTNFVSSLGKLGYSRPYHPQIIEENDYRNYTFAVSHLRAYYTKLFLNIKQEDLQDQNGTYFTSANDMAICIPALEQSHKRIAYVPELTYFYSINTGQNVHKNRLQEQRRNNLKIRAKQRYSPLQNLFSQDQV